MSGELEINRAEIWFRKPKKSNVNYVTSKYTTQNAIRLQRVSHIERSFLSRSKLQ